MAAAYLALKLGQAIEAAIPIAIPAVGFGRFFGRRNTILENVMIQSIGANSTFVVAGAVFTIPALYMLAGADGSGVGMPSVWQVMLVGFLGGSIGILFPVPQRHVFMVQNHGVFPWPEATATAEIMIAGEKTGDQAKVLTVAALVGGLYDALTGLFRAMSEHIRFIYVGNGASSSCPPTWWTEAWGNGWPYSAWPPFVCMLCVAAKGQGRAETDKPIPEGGEGAGSGCQPPAPFAHYLLPARGK